MVDSGGKLVYCAHSNVMGDCQQRPKAECYKQAHSVASSRPIASRTSGEAVPPSAMEPAWWRSELGFPPSEGGCAAPREDHDQQGRPLKVESRITPLQPAEVCSRVRPWVWIYSMYKQRLLRARQSRHGRKADVLRAPRLL